MQLWKREASVRCDVLSLFPHSPHSLRNVRKASRPPKRRGEGGEEGRGEDAMHRATQKMGSGGP